jgi:hypothetical protein
LNNINQDYRRSVANNINNARVSQANSIVINANGNADPKAIGDAAKSALQGFGPARTHEALLDPVGA